MTSPSPAAERESPPVVAECVPAGADEATRRRNFRYHAWALAGALVVLGLALALDSRGERRVTLPGIGRPLPELCMSRRLFAFDCPGCGLTRSFVSLAHGQVARAWHFNPAGLLWFGLLALQVPYRSWQLWRIRRGAAGEPWHSRWTIGLYWALVVSLLAQWVWKLVARTMA